MQKSPAIIAIFLIGMFLSAQDGSPGDDSQNFKRVRVNGLDHVVPTQEGSAIFSDSFESGDTNEWSLTVTGLGRPNCNCYFSGDCEAGMFCDWGPAGPFTEDICNWRTPKPNGTPGAGCDVDHNGGPGPICDGYCSPTRSGSIFGHEDPQLVRLGIQLWADAMLLPSVAGGGPVDADLSQQALDLPFTYPSAALMLGRHVADLLSVSAGFGFYDYFCHFEYDPNPVGYVVDLSQDPCKAQAGVLTIKAMVAELAEPGSGAVFIEQIKDNCPGWQTVLAPRCPPGPDALDCLRKRIEGAARFLSIPVKLQ